MDAAGGRRSPRPGSSARHSLGRSHSASSSCSRISSNRRRSSAASSRSRATWRAPSSSGPTSRPVPAASSAANSGQRRWEASARSAAGPRPSSPRRPGPASRRRPSMLRRRADRARARRPTGPAAPLATRRQGRSRRRRRRARQLSLVRFGTGSSFRAGEPRPLPAPALPGSGSDGRRPVAALSAHGLGSRCPFTILPTCPLTPSMSSEVDGSPTPGSTSSARPAPPAATPRRCSPRRSRGGVDVIQMREKAPRCAEELIALRRAVRPRRPRARRAVLPQRRPDLVEACGADGVHVGQDDEPVAAARAQRGPRRWSASRPTARSRFDAARSATGGRRGPTRSAPARSGRRRPRRDGPRPGSS